jgi:hypothetical protein
MEWLFVPVLLYVFFRNPTEEEKQEAAEAKATKAEKVRRKELERQAAADLAREGRRRATFVRDQEDALKKAYTEIERIAHLSTLEKEAAKGLARTRFLRALEEFYQQ